MQLSTCLSLTLYIHGLLAPCRDLLTPESRTLVARMGEYMEYTARLDGGQAHTVNSMPIIWPVASHCTDSAIQWSYQELFNYSEIILSSLYIA
jgi:hypothetical protein